MREHRHTGAHPAPSPRPAARAPHAALDLQRAAGNRAAARLLARDPVDVRRPSRWLPESPTLNIFALQQQQLLATEVRTLTERERDIAEQVFGQSLDLDRVRIAVTTVLAAPTTLGNTIRSETRELDDATLVHELTHVWQYQTSGLRYISCALAGQVQGEVAHGTRNWAYEYDANRTDTRFGDYGPEQQASIIEDAWKLHRIRDTQGFYARMLAVIRSARPRPDNPGFDMSEAAGLTGPRRLDPTGPLAPSPRAEEMGGTVPQLEWRFNLP